MGAKHLTCSDISENTGKRPTSISEIFHNIGMELYRHGEDQKTHYFETKIYRKRQLIFYCCQVNLLKIKSGLGEFERKNK